MSIMFIISPTYLKNLYSEALKYDFKLQGYGNVTNALKGLLKTNITDILGFAYVNTRLPSDLRPLRYFMRLCGMISECEKYPKKFVFALHDVDGIVDLFNTDFGNIDFSYLELETLTDIEINRGIFGSILKSNFNPYEISLKKDNAGSFDTDSVELTKNDLLALHDAFPVLSCHPAINQYYLQVFETYVLLSKLEDTVKQDEIFQDFSAYNKDLAELRKIYINADYISVYLDTTDMINSAKENTVYLEKIKLFKNRVDLLIGKLDSIEINDDNCDRFILYKSIIFILRKKCLELHERLNRVKVR